MLKKDYQEQRDHLGAHLKNSVSKVYQITDGILYLLMLAISFLHWVSWIKINLGKKKKKSIVNLYYLEMMQIIKYILH